MRSKVCVFPSRPRLTSRSKGRIHISDFRYPSNILSCKPQSVHTNGLGAAVHCRIIEYMKFVTKSGVCVTIDCLCKAKARSAMRTSNMLNIIQYPAYDIKFMEEKLPIPDSFAARNWPAHTSKSKRRFSRQLGLLPCRRELQLSDRERTPVRPGFAACLFRSAERGPAGGYG